MNVVFSANSGTGASSCLPVTISDDDLIEGDEIFTVSLGLVTTEVGISLGTQQTTTVTITDDESELRTAASSTMITP